MKLNLSTLLARRSSSPTTSPPALSPLRSEGVKTVPAQSGKSPLHCMERGFRGEVKLLFLALCFCLGAFPASAQNQSIPVSVWVTHTGVEVQRAQTVNWLPLVVDAVAPLTSGDAVRTDHLGRALLTFGDTQILLLPDSTLTLTTVAADQFAAHLDGHAIQQTSAASKSSAANLQYQLTAGSLTITQPADLFAVWSTFEQTSVITVAQGQAVASDQTVAVPVASGQAYYIGAKAPVSFDPPYNAARFFGILNGCPGQLQIGAMDYLNVRAGPGTGFVKLDYIPRAAPDVILMGINQSRGWYRIQRSTGFGWVQALAVPNHCGTLPVYPDTTEEHNNLIDAIRAEELPFVEPFYGLPSESVWFYRYIPPATTPTP